VIIVYGFGVVFHKKKLEKATSANLCSQSDTERGGGNDDAVRRRRGGDGGDRR
jgi:hypothetical protein